LQGSGDVVLIGKKKRQAEAMMANARECNGVQVRDKARGFSLVELLVVMAVILIVAAFAIPTMVTSIDAYRVRGTMSSVAGLTQRCRLLALKKNSSAHMFVAVNAGSVLMYCKEITDATPLNSSDPQITLPNQFSIPGTPTGGPTQLTATALWGSAGSTFRTDLDPYFNSRGLPCDAVAAGTACKTIVGYLYYFKYTSKNTRWAAVSISPASRIQNWFWNGTGWGN
jgi:prepilin-type N-terminal cleavage/methylation domain-containing protein